VLVLGENWNGEGANCSRDYNRSKRSNRAFIRVNCAAISGLPYCVELFADMKKAPSRGPLSAASAVSNRPMEERSS